MAKDAASARPHTARRRGAGPGRLTLGLYNSYDARRFVEPHRRALARAGTTAAAFDCNLAAFGFPFHHLAEQSGVDDVDPRDPRRIAQWVAASSSIGAGGEHFVHLAESGRFHVEPIPARGFPPQYGVVVLATSRVDAGASTTGVQLARMLANGESLLLILGLGPHGFPRKLEESAAHRYEITGKGLSMETCTALGAAPAQIMAHLMHFMTEEPPRDPTSRSDPPTTRE